MSRELELNRLLTLPNELQLEIMDRLDLKSLEALESPEVSNIILERTGSRSLIERIHKEAEDKRQYYEDNAYISGILLEKDRNLFLDGVYWLLKYRGDELMFEVRDDFLNIAVDITSRNLLYNLKWLLQYAEDIRDIDYARGQNCEGQDKGNYISCLANELWATAISWGNYDIVRYLYEQFSENRDNELYMQLLLMKDEYEYDLEDVINEEEGILYDNQESRQKLMSVTNKNKRLVDFLIQNAKEDQW